MERRTFLLAALSAGSLLAVTACTSPEPVPTAMPSGTPTPSPTPSPSLSDSGVPAPSAFARSAWTTDDFALGSSSYLPVGVTADERAALAQPIGSRLFMAGEATAQEKAGSVAGAWLSGVRAAEEVAQVAVPGDRIVVLGAGMAGAAAARQLVAAGFDVVVLEARDRVGGRIDTLGGDEWPFPVERGAFVIADLITNPLVGEIVALGIDTVLLDTAVDVRGADGTVSPAGDDPDGAMVATDLDRPIARSGWDGEDGLPSRAVVGGFRTVVEGALTGVDVRLSSAVAGVTVSEDVIGLRLATGESFAADRLIVTVSLGVLKAGSIAFDPPLPDSHSAAIATLGMDSHETVVLRFEDVFWSSDAAEWLVTDGDALVRSWYNLEPLTGQAVLVGVVGAEEAARFAELSDDEVRDGALASLAPFAS